jgi:hypothetical protein
MTLDRKQRIPEEKLFQTIFKKKSPENLFHILELFVFSEVRPKNSDSDSKT